MTENEFKRNILFVQELSNLARMGSNLRELLDSDKREDRLISACREASLIGIANLIEKFPNSLLEPPLLKIIRGNADFPS